MSEDAPLAPVNTATIDAASAPKQERRTVIDLMPKRMAALALAGTVALSAIATAKEGDAIGFAKAVDAAIQAEPGVQSIGAEGTTADLGPVDHPFSLKLSAKDEKTSYTTYDAETDEINRKAPMPWALEFSDDPQAENTERAEKAIEDVFISIEDYKSKGFDVIQVDVRGYASDEDNSAGGGLRKPSKLNRELADTRADAVAGLVNSELQKINLDVPVLMGSGKEIIDRKLDKRIDDLAKERGMSTLELVQKYNRDKDAFSPEDLAILNGLADDRFVNIKVSFLKPPVASEKRETDGGDIIIVPFLIPLFRIRRPVRAPKEGKTFFGGLEPALAGGYVPRREFVTDRRPAQTLDRRPFEVIKQPRNKNFSNRAQGKVGGRRGSDRDGRRGTRRG